MAKTDFTDLIKKYNSIDKQVNEGKGNWRHLFLPHSKSYTDKEGQRQSTSFVKLRQNTTKEGKPTGNGHMYNMSFKLPDSWAVPAEICEINKAINPERSAKSKPFEGKDGVYGLGGAWVSIPVIFDPENPSVTVTASKTNANTDRFNIPRAIGGKENTVVISRKYKGDDGELHRQVCDMPVDTFVNLYQAKGALARDYNKQQAKDLVADMLADYSKSETPAVETEAEII